MERVRNDFPLTLPFDFVHIVGLVLRIGVTLLNSRSKGHRVSKPRWESALLRLLLFPVVLFSFKFTMAEFFVLSPEILGGRTDEQTWVEIETQHKVVTLKEEAGGRLLEGPPLPLHDTYRNEGKA
jgi:hypothetical protein